MVDIHELLIVTCFAISGVGSRTWGGGGKVEFVLGPEDMHLTISHCQMIMLSLE